MAYTDGQSKTKGGVEQVNGLYSWSVEGQGWGWTGEWLIQMVSQGPGVGLDK